VGATHGLDRKKSSNGLYEKCLEGEKDSDVWPLRGMLGVRSPTMGDLGLVVEARAPVIRPLQEPGQGNIARCSWCLTKESSLSMPMLNARGSPLGAPSV